MLIRNNGEETLSQLAVNRSSWIWQIASGGLGLASILLMYFTKQTLLSTALFCIMMAVVTLSLVQILSKLSGAFKPLAIFLLPLLLVCFFLGAYLLRVMPYLGYLGQIMDVLLRIWLVALLAGVPLLWFGQLIRVRRCGLAQLLIALQVVLIVAQICVFGISQWLPGWQARGLIVQVVRLEDGQLSAPLVEGETAWLARYSYQGNHTLDQLDLASGSVLRRIPLPNITPQQLGRPNWVDAGMALRIWQAAISRSDKHLVVQYPTEFFSDSDEPVEQVASIRQIVDVEQGQVVDWEPLFGEGAQTGFVPGPDFMGELDQLKLQVGEYQVSWVSGKLHFRSTTKHYLLRCACPSYLTGLDDQSILMGARSELYIIRIK